MTRPEKDPLSPSSKDPSEGARGPAKGGGADGPLDESHLGAGGDPAEGKPDRNDRR